MQGGGDTYQNDDYNGLKMQVEVEDELSRFEMESLRGKRRIVNQKEKKIEWIKIAPNSKDLCNELGIREIMGRLRGRCTRVSRLTYKPEEQIQRDMFRFHMSLIELFSKRGDIWQMDEEMAKPIIDACVEFVQDIVSSSRNGFTAVNIRSSYSRNEVEKVGDGKQPKTFLGIGLNKG